MSKGSQVGAPRHQSYQGGQSYTEGKRSCIPVRGTTNCTRPRLHTNLILNLRRELQYENSKGRKEKDRLTKGRGPIEGQRMRTSCGCA